MNEFIAGVRENHTFKKNSFLIGEYLLCNVLLVSTVPHESAANVSISLAS